MNETMIEESRAFVLGYQHGRCYGDNLSNLGIVEKLQDLRFEATLREVMSFGNGMLDGVKGDDWRLRKTVDQFGPQSLDWTTCDGVRELIYDQLRVQAARTNLVCVECGDPDPVDESAAGPICQDCINRADREWADHVAEENARLYDVERRMEDLR